MTVQDKADALVVGTKAASFEPASVVVRAARVLADHPRRAVASTASRSSSGNGM